MSYEIVELAHQWRRKQPIKYSGENTERFKGILSFIEYIQKEGCIISPAIPSNDSCDNCWERDKYRCSGYGIPAPVPDVCPYHAR